jgi:peptidoglycan/xylan/chitin deacetylase (PgdA/CDA1 family)
MAAIGKRELAARIFARTGVTSLLESVPRRGVLLVLNYHRIGDAHATPYDSGVFSGTAEELDEQVRYLKRHFHIATLDEVVESIATGGPRHATVLITFDDGYIDNYQLAFPVLRSHGVQGVFFLPTAFVGTNHLPWWDVVAYLVKQARTRTIQLQYPEPLSFALDQEGVANVIMHILLVCARPEVRTDDVISQLEAACDCRRPDANADRCYLDWNEAREMKQHGMAFGSHTHSHEILTKLPPLRQEEELRTSRETLEQELQTRIETLAYPVGLQTSFSGDTKRALETTGYRAAFSFYGGTNVPGQIERYDIQRYAIGAASPERFRLQLNVAALTRHVWP